MLQGERVLAVRNCLNREYLRAPFWPLEVMGSCPLRWPKVEAGEQITAGETA